MILSLLLSGLAGYIIGGLNFAIIITRLIYNKDIRQFGSKNAGMTNVLRNFGKLPAFLTFLGDFSKGIIAIWVGNLIYKYFAISDSYALYNQGLTAICALLGHVYPVFYGFKGGKGILVSAGIMLTIQPVSFGIVLLIFLAVVVISRIVSLASIISSIFFPFLNILVGILYHKNAYEITINFFVTLILSFIIIYMHKDNIKRLINGTEYKFSKKNK